MIKINEMQNGHKFSELSHYTFLKHDGFRSIFEHHGSGKEVSLGNDYVQKFLKNAEQYQEIIEVGREDKYWTANQIEIEIKKGNFTKRDAPKIGDLRQVGIRTIWESIHSQQVFTVCFEAASKETVSELARRRALAAEEILDNITDGVTSRMRVSQINTLLNEAILRALETPVVKTARERILRGYKVQFSSRDGRYNCIDMDLEDPDNSIRPVNINTLQWLVFDGIKYVVK